MSDRPIRRALIAVYDKTGIVDFARALVDEFGVEILSTGGTAKHLMDAGIPVTLVETVTGFPEMLDGRVKTLHPHIHAGILADRDNPEHMRQLAEHGIQPIDMVVVNLYPFEKTVAAPNCTFEQAIEMIDIGGPCLLRAAAKNHKHVLLVCTDSAFYSIILDKFRSNESHLINDLYASGATSAFDTTAEYDGTIATWLGNRYMRGEGHLVRYLRLWGWDVLRYGENPHQSAEMFGSTPSTSSLDLTTADADIEDSRTGQKTISFNNYVDADAALALCAELTRAKGGLWHRFVTGDLCHRFPTGGSSLKPQTPAPVQSSRTVAPRIDNEQLSQRNLPHIQRPEATYFITFRIRQGELSPAERDIVLNACRHWHQEKMTLHAVVVMPDHVHLLLTPHEIEPGKWIALGELLHSIKRHSANEINRLRGVSGALWLDESFDRVVRNEAEFAEKRSYIVANPVTAELCADEDQYGWTWTSDTGFMETVGKANDRLETGRTVHRLQTGATDSMAPQPMASTPAIASVCFIKHTNACGVGVAEDATEAYRAAYMGDPNAAMGGVLAVNFVVTKAFAEVVMETYDRFGKSAGAGGFFVEVWVAPSFDEDAVEVIRMRKKWGANVRLLSVGDMAADPDPTLLEYKTIAGGFLAQMPDVLGLNEDDWKVVTHRAPTDVEMADLRLAWLIAKHTKSNAISLCKDGMLIGNGAGQMSRVMSCRIATWLARENGHAEKLPGAAAASDAFFPFKDGPDILLDAGVTAIIQPGGSKRDEEVIAACDARGAAMIFTGTRHFKH